VTPSFTEQQEATLRPRFVLDRIDGQPVLVGHAECPECEIGLVPGRTGTMEFRGENVRLTLHVKCPSCRRRMNVQDDFEPQEDNDDLDIPDAPPDDPFGGDDDDDNVL